MSTRSIIGTAHDGGFTGRYAHWDGYPSAKGPQLQETFAELGSWEAVRDYAIREGQTGYWSSFAAPSYVAEQEAKPEKVLCKYCHGTGTRTDMKVANGCNGCRGTGQMSNPDRHATWSATERDMLVPSHEDVGAEWAYLLDAKGITVLSLQRYDGGRAVGMFGSIGDGYWRRDSFVAWTELNVDWGRIEALADAEIVDAEVVEDDDSCTELVPF